MQHNTAMYLWIRYHLPLLTAAVTLAAFWHFWRTGYLFIGQEPNWPVVLLTLLAMLITMIVIDRAWCTFVAWWIGRDRASIQWWEYRNTEGMLACRTCDSIFVCLPENRLPESVVHCGDCGAIFCTLTEFNTISGKIGELAFSRLRARVLGQATMAVDDIIS